MPEALPGVGAVNRRRLDQALRHLLQSREKDHHRIAEPPHSDHDQTPQCMLHKPIGAVAAKQRRIYRVEITVFGVKDECPSNRRRHRRQQRGQKEDRAIIAHALDLRHIEHQRRKQGHRYAERHRQHAIGDGHLNAIVKTRLPALEDDRIVVEADPSGRITDRILGERQIDRAYNRPEDKYGEPD